MRSSDAGWHWFGEKKSESLPFLLILDRQKETPNKKVGDLFQGYAILLYSMYVANLLRNIFASLSGIRKKKFFLSLSFRHAEKGFLKRADLSQVSILAKKKEEEKAFP